MSSSLPDLVHHFDSLAVPVPIGTPGRFMVREIPGHTSHSLGKDTDGNPVLLVQTNEAHGGTATAIELEHLTVLHQVNCRVAVTGQAEQERMLSVIRCTNSDREFHEYFLRALPPVVASLSNTPSCQQVSDAVGRLVELFQQITRAPRKTLSGIWGELLVIARAREPDKLLRAWHSILEERYDFGTGNDRVEVKVAVGRIRKHHFGLEQLRPPAHVRVMIVSLMTEPLEGGTTVADLVRDIRARVNDPRLLMQLDNCIAQTIGSDWRSLRRSGFDLALAVDSIRFADAKDLPAVEVPVPVEVSAVHFQADLTSYVFSTPPDLVQTSSLFCAATPKDLEKCSNLQAKAVRCNPTPVTCLIHLKNAWDKYYNTGELETVNDLANEVSKLIDEGKAPQSLAAVIEDYRKAQQEDHALSGRGDMDEAEQRLIATMQTYLTYLHDNTTGLK